jgi:hypothetical protein
MTNDRNYNSICMVTSLLLSDLRKYFYIVDLTTTFYVHIDIFKKFNILSYI